MRKSIKFRNDGVRLRGAGREREMQKKMYFGRSRLKDLTEGVGQYKLKRMEQDRFML